MLMEMTGLIDSTELRAQLEQLHRESYGWALNCCARDSSQAEDVLQSVYLKILEGKARFDGKSTLKMWLFAVIRRTAADERRRSRWRHLWFSSNQSDIEPAAEPDNLDEAIDRMRVQALFQRALEDLPGRQREVLELVFCYDLSLADAASVMRVSPRLRAHALRARQKTTSSLAERFSMNQDREEKKITELFDELKRQDQLHVPSFARLWAAAVSQSERAPTLLNKFLYKEGRGLRLVAAVAMVLLVAGSLAILFKQPSGPSASIERAEFAVTISGWRSPTDFLLAPVDKQLLRTVPRLDESLHEIQTITSYKN